MTEYFKSVKKIEYEGKDSDNPLSFKHYNENEIVGNNTMKDHLRFSTAFWHTFGGTGQDPFGEATMIWSWKIGQKFRFFVQKQPGKISNTTDTLYYVFDIADNKWIHSCTINSPNSGFKSVSTISGSINSFLENFSGQNVKSPKLALYRLWLGDMTNLKSLTKSGGDNGWGQLGDSYFLAEGSGESLKSVFASVVEKYGKPIFGRENTTMKPISSRPIPADVLTAIPKVQLAADIK